MNFPPAHTSRVDLAKAPRTLAELADDAEKAGLDHAALILLNASRLLEVCLLPRKA